MVCSMYLLNIQTDFCVSFTFYNIVAAMIAWILDIVAATNSHIPFSGPFNLYEKNIFRLINFVFNLIVTGLIGKI